MILPRIRADEGPEDRTKVSSPAGRPRRLVAVATGSSRSSNQALAAEIAGQGLSRRKIMERFSVGSARATAIKALASDISTEGGDHGAQTSAR